MKGVLIGWLLLVAGACRAQTTAEWLEQNKTRLKYYEQQIVTLQTYIGYAQKGYSIMESGLNTISELKAGEFNLHNAFYNSLETRCLAALETDKKVDGITEGSRLGE